MLSEHVRNFGLGMDAVGNRTQRGWMLSWSPHGCSAKNAMHGGSSDFEAKEGPKALFVPRRPVPMGSGVNAFFARLTPLGALNKKSSGHTPVFT